MAGGWGVDVLVGRQTRHHRDLDLAVDADHLDQCLATCAGLGYVTETDWLPLRVELRASADRWVDVHPVAFDVQGCGVLGDPLGTHFNYPLTAFTTGMIGDREMPCLSAGQQEIFHSGYELRPQDQHDLALLGQLKKAGTS